MEERNVKRKIFSLYINIPKEELDTFDAYQEKGWSLQTIILKTNLKRTTND
ncbi:MAG: hypothetical protein CM15mV25_0390 [uncultured marine virus]|nr:MAG: hypothetical protein CM15mV25_0390 [uncultured marine virus]